MNTDLQYIQDVFGAAEWQRDPYPHLVVRNALPEGLYNDLIQNIPPRETFRYTSPGGAEQQNTIIHDDDGSRHDLLHEAFTLISSILTELLQPTTEQTLATLGATGAPEYEPSHSYSLIDRTQLYSQPPHLDGCYRYGAWLLYLPLDDIPQRGTELYRAIKTDEFDPVAVFRDRQPTTVSLTDRKTVPFLPNTVLACANTPTSFHSLLTLPGMTERRITMNNWLQFTRESYDRCLGHLPDYSEAYGR